MHCKAKEARFCVLPYRRWHEKACLCNVDSKYNSCNSSTLLIGVGQAVWTTYLRKKIIFFSFTASEDGSGLDGLVNIVFIELPKIKKLETKGIENLNSLEKWGIFLKEADQPEKINLIEEIAKQEEGIQMAYNTLNKMSESQEAWLMQTAQLIAKKDYMTQMEYSRQEGLAEGAHKNQIQVAKNLISMKVLTDEQICQASGLTIEELVELKK